jgi:microcystin-dependent protein
MSTLATPAQPGPEQQDAPLTEAERKQLNRMLSDPTYFPIEFRTWIRTYLEGSDIKLPSSAIVGGNAPKVNLPAGVILPYAGGEIPSNCMLCDGRALVRADWDLLFQAIGTTWGAPSGSQFNIPDLRDRTLYGAGSVVGFGGSDGRAFGSRGGPRHQHYFGQTSDGGGNHNHGGSTSTDGSHTHGAESDMYARTLGNTYIVNSSSGNSRYLLTGYMGATAAGGSHSHSIGTDDSGDHTHWVEGYTSGGYDQDQGAWAGINYIIATGKNI